SVKPEPRQRDTGGAAEHGHHVGAEPGRILGTETGHCKSIPAGDADLAAERFRRFANPLYDCLIARHNERRADGDAALRNGRPRQFLADVAVEPDGFRKHELSATAQAPAVDELA